MAESRTCAEVDAAAGRCELVEAWDHHRAVVVIQGLQLECRTGVGHDRNYRLRRFARATVQASGQRIAADVGPSGTGSRRFRRGAQAQRRERAPEAADDEAGARAAFAEPPEPGVAAAIRPAEGPPEPPRGGRAPPPVIELAGTHGADKLIVCAEPEAVPANAARAPSDWTGLGKPLFAVGSSTGADPPAPEGGSCTGAVIGTELAPASKACRLGLGRLRPVALGRATVPIALPILSVCMMPICARPRSAPVANAMTLIGSVIVCLRSSRSGFALSARRRGAFR